LIIPIYRNQGSR